VWCDPGRLAQLLSNLLANAVTHGHAGTPVVARARSDGETFELSVSNAGDPIPAATVERLFQPFFRGDARSSGNAGGHGLGLGLYIASEIARAHGGTLKAMSSPEQTIFTLRMPVTRGA
jgi:sigma-B regulation protein RsbU (phosphoserine phosphatase)